MYSCSDVLAFDSVLLTPFGVSTAGLLDFVDARLRERDVSGSGRGVAHEGGLVTSAAFAGVLSRGLHGSVGFHKCGEPAVNGGSFASCT